MDNPGCGNCGRSPNNGETFSHCSRCKVVPYCSKTCQKQHWKNGHKQTCQNAREREEDMMKKQNKTMVDEEKPWKGSGKPRKPNNSSGRGAAVEEQKPKPPRRITARVDAGGKELSFGENEHCAICTDKLVNPVKLPCGHWYCKECIEGVRQRKPLPDSCPLCRESLPRRGADQLFDEVAEVHTLAEGSGYRPWGCLGLRPDL